jgi:signal transduction histidine kinase
VPVKGDELGEISHNIVRLYARLQQTASERDRQHRAALHEQKEKERIKKQLTNNINHELKTPVASIRICIETLLCHEGMPQEKRRDFLERCMADTDRLARLLEDVSILTRMDDGAASISKTGIDLAATIREAADEQRPAADAKRIAIYCSVGDGITIEGNPALLESIFRNLIANAISYSGGTEITIRETQSMPGQVTLEVADNGCGIPEEHLPRIFERFYRIDKGRSRAAGGTGLGLAIVKNAVVFHGGSISARNQQDGGIAFRITLPTRQHTA